MYTADFVQSAPQFLFTPTGQPVYGGVGTEDVSTVSLSSYTTISQSSPTRIDAGALTMSYDASDGVSIHNRRGLTVLKDSVPHDTWLHLYGTCIDSVSAVNLIRTTRPFYTFSDFTLGYLIDVPLDLELSRFKANQVKQGVSNAWTTQNEKSISSFVLERSTNGQTYSAINSQKAKGTGSRNEYRYLDEEALSLGVDRLYYRLKMTAEGGKVSYSQTEVINLSETALEEMSVFPVPFDRELEIELALPNDEDVSLVISDVIGREVWNKEVSFERGSSHHTLDLSPLPNGTYFLKVKTAGKVETRKIIKQ